MIIVSIDVGIRNLAICVIKRTLIEEEETKSKPAVSILYWDVFDVSPSSSAAAAEAVMTTDRAQSNCHATLSALHKIQGEIEHITKAKPDMVVIERQPPRSAMVAQSMIVYSSFVDRYGCDVPVAFISARSKFPKTMVIPKGRTAYRARKALAIQLAMNFLINSSSTPDWISKFTKHKKRDDLADALLQALAKIPEHAELLSSSSSSSSSSPNI